MRVSTTGVVAGLNGFVSPRWQRHGWEIFYLDARGLLIATPVHSKGDSVEIGEGLPLFRLTPAQGIRNFWDVSGDGQRFLASIAEQAPPAPITLVVNWTAALKK